MLQSLMVQKSFPIYMEDLSVIFQGFITYKPPLLPRIQG